MSDDEILRLASETSGAHYMDHSHVIRFARAVIDKAASAEPVAWRIAGRFGWFYQDDPPYESQRGRTAQPLYISPPDHREVMRMALEYVSWHAHGECRVGTGPIPASSDVVAALRAALK